VRGITLCVASSVQASSARNRVLREGDTLCELTVRPDDGVDAAAACTHVRGNGCVDRAVGRLASR
jgi:hypothetical protein